MLMDLLYRDDADQEAVAVVHRDERITRRDLVERIERLACGLAELGVGPGDAVAVLLPNTPDFVVSVYAITGLGAIVAPLNPQLKHDELDFRFRQCDVRAVICDDRSMGVCERIVSRWDRPATVITTGSGHGHSVTLASLIEAGTATRLAPRDAGETFVYQFSSGSTGRPKRVGRTHGNVVAEAVMYPEAMRIGPDDAVFCTVPLFHDYGMTCCILASTPAGAGLVLLEDPNPLVLKRHRALELIEVERPTVFPGVPFTYRVLAEAPREADLSSLRWCFSAGTALPRETFNAFLERFGVPVRQLYGCSEAGTLAANLDPDPVATFESVGKPVGEVRAAVLGEDGEQLPVGEIGELAISSPALMSGYLDEQALNAEAFRDGLFRTGDLGRLDEEGRVYITGRQKLLIEVGGYKVDPIEVEDVVLEHPAVGEVVVVGVPGDIAGEETVKAVVVPVAESDERDIVRFCLERLANYKVPQIVEFREQIPKSDTGKILRHYMI